MQLNFTKLKRQILFMFYNLQKKKEMNSYK